MKDIGKFKPEEVLSFAGKGQKAFRGSDGKEYKVHMNSVRYHLFSRSRRCVCCGLQGTTMVLEFNGNLHRPHFNLYGQLDGEWVLFTKDHILPKSKGGSDSFGNMQVMCTFCNGKKKNKEMTVAELRELDAVKKHRAQVNKAKRKAKQRRSNCGKKHNGGICPHQKSEPSLHPQDVEESRSNTVQGRRRQPFALPRLQLEQSERMNGSMTTGRGSPKGQQSWKVVR